MLRPPCQEVGMRVTLISGGDERSRSYSLPVSVVRILLSLKTVLAAAMAEASPTSLFLTNYLASSRHPSLFQG